MCENIKELMNSESFTEISNSTLPLKCSIKESTIHLVEGSKNI